jgi:hypothetical protein
MNNELERRWKETINLLSQHLLEGLTEENYTNPESE